MTMTLTNNVPQFLKTWQATLQEAIIAGCIFIDVQQVNLLFGALFETWSTFITIEGRLDNLTFIDSLFNILQQSNINNSMQSNSKAKSTNVFYIKDKFIIFMIQSKSNKFKKYAVPQRITFNPIKPLFRPLSSRSNIICYYYGILGYKALDC